MSFLDGKKQIATQKDLDARWSGKPNGKNFRCYLCGYKFKLGDYWRFVYAAKINKINFLVCENCDSEDVLEKWNQAHEELNNRFWWAIEE
jgi:hypothetical protein